MNKDNFNNPDKLQLLSFRKWLRNNMPKGRDGFVVEDLDLVIRWFGYNYGFDSVGAFMLIELKFGSAEMDVPQIKLWGLIDSLLRKADPERKRYFGFYLIQYTDDDWNVSGFRINKQSVTREQFVKFWERKFIVEEYFK
mgnify:CR=1 FL=1